MTHLCSVTSSSKLLCKHPSLSLLGYCTTLHYRGVMEDIIPPQNVHRHLRCNCIQTLQLLESMYVGELRRNKEKQGEKSAKAPVWSMTSFKSSSC